MKKIIKIYLESFFGVGYKGFKAGVYKLISLCGMTMAINPNKKMQEKWF